MAYFPIFIELAGRKCLVFGGGKVAYRKIKTLLKYDAHVEVFSREIIPEIREILPENRIHITETGGLPENEMFRSKAAQGLSLLSISVALGGADLVIAATSDRKFNEETALWCRKHHTPVDVIDAPEECTFLFPSVVKKGDISIGINTGAKSPIVSRQVRKDIEKAIPDYYADIAAQLGEVREYVKHNFTEESDRRAILKTVAASAFARKEPLTDEELSGIYRKYS